LSQGDTVRYGFARADWATAGSLARADWARADWARADWARADWGRGDDGRGDLGGGDLFVGDPNNPGGELDFETATLLANTPPYVFRACMIGVDESCSGGSLSDSLKVRADWTAANEGGELRYVGYRVQGTKLEPGQAWVPVGTVPAIPGQIDYSLIDDDLLVKGTDYLYFAVAVYDREVEGTHVEVQSEPSNLVSIKGPNHAPVANAQSVTTAEDTSMAITLTASDDVGDPATYSVASGPGHGTLSGTPPYLTYTPAANYNGSDSFTFKVNDGSLDSNEATVSINVTAVNDAPVAGKDGYTTAEDTPLNQGAPGVLVNDVDIDSSLTAVLVTGPSHGILVLNANGSFTYTPAADDYGDDAFTYKAYDGLVYTDPATVSITVTAVNDAPTAVNDSYSILKGSGLTIAAPGVLGNDTDVDSSPLTAALNTGPSNGTLVLNTNGSFTYTPAPSFVGLVSFTYKANDGSLDSNVATVSITVKASYTLFGLQNVPPAVICKAKAGSTVPMKWQFKDGPLVVNSSQVGHEVKVVGPLPGGPIRTFVNTDPGTSWFRYDAATKTWYFNLQTKDASGVAYPVGNYNVTITPTTPGYLPSPTFILTLTKY
jgi:VCBS repeat-containing protein